MSYSPLDFKTYYPDVVIFTALADNVIQRAIDIVECTWNSFSCYPEDKRLLMHHLATAHTLLSTGACIDSSGPWFNPMVSEVKSYNDTIKLTANDGNLESTQYGRSLKNVMNTSRSPMLYFSGNGGPSGGGCY